MKTIGIKLADGTFYPVLEEGAPKKRMLDLTTAKDNQTKVQIDLYRSENGTMTDAEYVDTLEVTKLNPHPNGEPELHLSVGLDENNRLTAEVVDPETGKKSETEVTLVTRTEAERNADNDFGISGIADEKTVASDDTLVSSEDPVGTKDALEDIPFSFGDSESKESAESNDSFDGALPDFSNLDNEFDSDETQDDTPTSENPADNFSADDFSLPDFEDTSIGEDSLEDSPIDESEISESEDFDSSDFDAQTSSNDSDFDSDTASAGSAMDFSDLYDKETLAGEHASIYDEGEEGKKIRVPVLICIICAVICVIATILLLFIVPSKYNLLASRNTNGVSILERLFSKETVVEEEVKEAPQIQETTIIDVKPEAPSPSAQKPAPKEEVRKPEPPKQEAAPEAVEDKIVIAPEPEKVVPKPTPAEEKRAETRKSSAVKYHIRWGDTLWDISESYYKTPWKYTRIADYNKIKNPDYIVAGTDILIPAE